jgi:hypothetical protein
MTALETAKIWLLAFFIAAPGFFSNWQTLIAGLLALIGAGWTVRNIRRQIEQTDDLERKRQQRDERAARAALPLALNELTQYCDDCIRLLVRYVPAKRGESEIVEPTLSAPAVPDGIISTFQAIARNEDTGIANEVAGVLSRLQIQSARLRGLVLRSIAEGRGRMSFQEGCYCIFDAADLHAHANRLFGYPRDLDGLRKFATEAELKSALRSAGIRDGDHPGLWKLIEKRTEGM